MKINHTSLRHSRMKSQDGMVLLLCLVFLTALTMLGLSASTEAILQNKLSTNLHESEHARQSALSALSWAEDWLLKQDGNPPETCGSACTGLKLHAGGNVLANPETKDLAWWREQGIEAGIDPLTGAGISSMTTSSFDPPFWIIELVHEIPANESGAADLQTWYRITVRGSGKTSASISVVESIVERSWASRSIEPPEAESSVLCPNTEASTTCGRVSWRELR